MGIHSTYTKETGDLICARLAEGESLRAVCRGIGLNYSTVIGWTEQFKEFADQYARARNIGIDAMAEETLAIARDGQKDMVTRTNRDGTQYEELDTEHVQRSRLAVDTMKWYVSKLAPKRYGDKLNVEHSGTVDIALSIVEARKRAGSE